jgi:hypothetical protein
VKQVPEFAVTQNEIADWAEVIIMTVTGPEAIDDHQ